MAGNDAYVTRAYRGSGAARAQGTACVSLFKSARENLEPEKSERFESRDKFSNPNEYRINCNNNFLIDKIY